MTGSIQKKGKKYYAVIALNGKRKWFKGGKKKDAERVLTERLAEVNLGTYREIPKTTFKEFAAHWIKTHAENNLKPSTIAGYNHILKKRLVPEFGDLMMTDISAARIQNYIGKRKSSYIERSKKKEKNKKTKRRSNKSMATVVEIPKPPKIVSSKAVSNEVIVIKEMFKHAYWWGYIRHNPAEFVSRPKVVKKEIEILELDEYSKLIENSGDLYRTAFLTTILTGLRAGELWALQWGDMDWNSKRLYVRRSVWNNTFQAPKTDNSIRKIDLPDNLIFELKKWKLACPLNGYDLMFPSREGNITNHDNAIKRHFEPALRRAGLRHVSFHSLRHTNASLRIHAGQNIKYLSTQLGHSSIKVTLDIYGHLFNDEDFNRQQVDLLQKTFHAVRNPLENPLQNAEKGLAVNANPL